MILVRYSSNLLNAGAGLHVLYQRGKLLYKLVNFLNDVSLPAPTLILKACHSLHGLETAFYFPDSSSIPK